jgi:hypothetical protein
MIALMRSATTTALPGLRREASDPALVKSVLGNDPDLMNRKNGHLPRSSSVSYLQDAKINKKAQVEAELRDAISSLRKPNRQVVGQALAEAAERRATVSSSAKSMYQNSNVQTPSANIVLEARKPIRSSFNTPVIKATPANVRFKDAFASRLNIMETPLISIEDVIPPSSLPSMVPSTGYRGGGQRNAFRQSRTPDFERIGSTPTKTASTFIRRPADDPDVLPFPPSSPCLERRTASAANLFNPTGVTDRKRKVSFESSRNDETLATPVKVIKTKTIEDLENIRMEPEPAKPVSIYQKLGWDDDIDDLL